jgi:hypothetical protein
MIIGQCVVGVCFVPLEETAPKFFGFSEFLASLALMVLAWTIADDRYRFRIRVAPLPLRGLTFGVVTAVGVLTLLTDLWRAQEWPVPKVGVLTPAIWQTLLAGMFFVTFLAWIWFAFIMPSRFGKWNAKRYAQTLYRFILKGSPTELAVVADELMYSAKEIVGHATDRSDFTHDAKRSEGREEPTKVEAYANDILLLLADKRFCRAIVESSPGTALRFFYEIGEAKKYAIQVQTFAKNIVSEALANKDSFLYHESDGYESGLIGYLKPLSKAMFANYEMVEMIGTMLDPDFSRRSKWDADQWEAYCRIVLLTFRDFVEKGHGGHSYTLYGAIENVKDAASDLYKLNGVTNSAWDDDLLARLQTIIDFIDKTFEILDKKGVPNDLKLRIQNKSPLSSRNSYDHIANLIFDIIFAASAVTSPRDQCWWIQHNLVWDRLFNFPHTGGKAAAAVKFKVCRLLYNEIEKMKRFPNFKGARILGFCLNVMGLKLDKGDDHKDSRALHKVLLTFTRKNYAWLHNDTPRVAEACLVDDVTYDVKKHRLVKTYPAEGLRRTPLCIYLDVDPPTSGSSNVLAEDAKPKECKPIGKRS